MSRKIVSLRISGLSQKKCFDVSEEACQELNAMRSGRGRI